MTPDGLVGLVPVGALVLRLVESFVCRQGSECSNQQSGFGRCMSAAGIVASRWLSLTAGVETVAHVFAWAAPLGISVLRHVRQMAAALGSVCGWWTAAYCLESGGFPREGRPSGDRSPDSRSEPGVRPPMKAGRTLSVRPVGVRRDGMLSAIRRGKAGRSRRCRCRSG